MEEEKEEYQKEEEAEVVEDPQKEEAEETAKKEPVEEEIPKQSEKEEEVEENPEKEEYQKEEASEEETPVEEAIEKEEPVKEEYHKEEDAEENVAEENPTKEDIEEEPAEGNTEEKEERTQKKDAGKDIDEDKKDTEKKDTSTKALKYIIIFLAVFAIVFAASYIYKDRQHKMEYDSMHKIYNHYSFDKEGVFWKSEWIKGNQPYILTFRYWPGELEDVPINGKLNLLFNNSKQVYISFDPEGGNFNNLALSASELTLSLVRALGKEPIAACLVNKTDACESRPIVTCDDEDKAVILLKNSDKESVTLEGNCMIIEGNDAGVIRSAERILYTWYGIMSVNP